MRIISRAVNGRMPFKCSAGCTEAHSWALRLLVEQKGEYYTLDDQGNWTRVQVVKDGRLFVELCDALEALGETYLETIQ